ncbi:MAG TPA: hypothetical protein VGE52_07330 [Pirellulales bacterium]
MKPLLAAAVVVAGLFFTVAPSEANAQGIYLGRGGIRVGVGPSYRYGGYGGYNYRPPYYSGYRGGYYRPYVRYGYRGPGVYPFTSGYRGGYYGRRW